MIGGDVLRDATAARVAAISGVWIWGYLEVILKSGLKFDCFELAVDSVTDVDGGEEDLVTALVEFC